MKIRKKKKIQKIHRIYISGAISGTYDAEERFGDAEEYLHIVYPEAEQINPQAIGQQIAYVSPEFSHAEYMCISKALMETCDAIFMIPGWQQSKGASWENGYAAGRGMKIIEMDKSWYQETEEPSTNISRMKQIKEDGRP